MSNAVKPRRTFLDRSARSTRRIENSRRRAQHLLLELAHARPAGDAARRLVVDRQRVRADPHLAVVDVDDAVLEVDVQVQEVAAAEQEVAPVRTRVEADDVVGQQPVVDLVADRRREHAPGVRLGPRDVDEVVQEDVRPRLADHRRQRVEVVVVDHHDRLVLALDLVHDRARQVRVDPLVALVEGHDLVMADVRRVAQVPQVVLDEPEHRVGDDVVEAVVGLVVGLDEADAERAALGRLDLERPAVVLARHVHVRVGHGGGDPDRVAVGGQARERGDQPARAALDGAVLLIRHRPAVGHEHERRLLRQRVHLRGKLDWNPRSSLPGALRRVVNSGKGAYPPESAGFPSGRSANLTLICWTLPPRWTSTGTVSPGL